MTIITAGAVSGMLHYVHDVDNQTERHIEVFEFALSIVFVAELTIRMRGYVVMHGMVSILWKAVKFPVSELFSRAFSNHASMIYDTLKIVRLEFGTGSYSSILP